MEWGCPDCNLYRLLRPEVVPEQRDVTRIVCNVQKMSLKCSLLLPPSSHWQERCRCAVWSLSGQRGSWGCNHILSHYYFWKMCDQTYILIYRIYKVILHINQIYLDSCKSMGLIERMDTKIRDSNDSKSFWPVFTCLQTPSMPAMASSNSFTIQRQEILERFVTFLA